MALQSIIDLSLNKDVKKIGVSEERVREILPAARQYVAFWREYPDIMVDFMIRGNGDEKKSTFKLMFYQRVCKKAPLPCEE